MLRLIKQNWNSNFEICESIRWIAFKQMQQYYVNKKLHLSTLVVNLEQGCWNRERPASPRAYHNLLAN